MKKHLCIVLPSAAAICAALAVHGLTASSSYWYLRTFTVAVTAGLAAWSVAALFRVKL